ncbi:MAG: SMI1/KNR4 family protein [Cyanobacteria bacterium J06649_11]
MNETIIKKCENVIQELMRFSDEILFLGGKVNNEIFEEFDKEIGHPLPDDYKFFISRFNGFSLMGTEVYGIRSKLDIIKNYDIEHKKVVNPQFDYLVPFSPNGRGDHYCFDTRKIYENGTCPIVFWQWDYSFYHPNDIEITNNSFVDWVQEVMVEWTLEEYDYNGIEK